MRTSGIVAGVALTLVVGLLVGCGDSTTTAGQAEETGIQSERQRCPFKWFKGPGHVPSWMLPSRMSRGQVKACQAHFAQISGARFEPGSRAFSSQYCSKFSYRSRGGVCQDVRIAVCRLAVDDGKSTHIKSCLARGPGSRIVVRRRLLPEVSVVIREPMVFRYSRLALVDDAAERWFGSNGGYVDFHAFFGRAWDSEAAREVPIPADLTALVARSPYVRVVDRREVRMTAGSASVLDVVVERADAQRACPLSDRVEVPCVPVLVYTSGGSDAQDVSFSLLPGDAYRLIHVRLGGERFLMTVAGFSHFDQLKPVDALLRTVRVG